MQWDFLNWPLVVKAIHSLSGEKNGPTAPSVPGIGVASFRSMGRK